MGYEYQHNYYLAHREERIAYQREHYAMTKRMMLKYHPEKWAEVVAKRRAASKASRERNKAKYFKTQRVIRDVRQARGMRQKDLAEMLGVSQACIRYYESGEVRAPWDKLIAVMPELKELRRNVQMF